MSIIGLNTGLVDIWSLVHFVAGFAVVWGLALRNRPALKLTLILFFVGFIAWEIFEVSQGPGGFGGQETGANLLADLLFAGIGGLVAIFLARSRGGK